ncbi:zinc-binding dehydrogenase [Herbiconiux moechotypicola]|uniref:Zn-dependent alcohol dehydrogenase n=1 Tax=Herbiconiux moechotypicola TaxID=637393 RepID=A0ABN3DXQ1_9MICO|nr:zinc-binding dehydrogenase [Herbiconiux moechotypicola]MCS5730841.1 zinc-binding dehydrogenase [Herbiconiux moechotypicola]
MSAVDRSEVRAAVAHRGAREFTLETVALRDPGPRDVVVSIDATAFCYSDWIALRGDSGLPELDPDPYPVVLGHSAVGTVVEAGRDARHRAGDRVLITATPECGECFWCRAGRIDQCEQLFVPPPVIGRLADGREVRAPGAAATYAELTVLRDIQVFPLLPEGEGLADAHLAMFGCGIVSGMGAVVNVGEVIPGSSVVVVGCGQEGLWMVQAARMLGAATIVAVDPIASRRALALRIGATHAVDPGEVAPRDAVLDATHGRGADTGFDAGGTLESVGQAFACTRLGGTVVVTSYVRRDSEVALPLFDLALRGRDVRSSQSGRLDMRRDQQRFLPWLASGAVDADAMLGTVRPLERIDDALTASRTRTELTPVLVP